MAFVYIWSISLWFVDVTFFAEDPVLAARGIGGQALDTDALLEADGARQIAELGNRTANPINNGSIIDRISGAVAGGATSTWTLLELLSGTYAFNTLEFIGVHPNFITMLKLIFPMVVAVTIVYYITGRP